MSCTYEQTLKIIELYKHYQESGRHLSSPITTTDVSHYFSDKLGILHAEDCASNVGSHNFLYQSSKLVAQRDASEENTIEQLVRLVKYEVTAIPKANVSNCDLSQLTCEKISNSKSTTLLILGL